MDEIKSHAFFSSINWVKLEAKEVEPPFVPKLKKPTDTAYFYKSFTTADKKDSVALISVTDETQERFRNFSFTNLTELTGTKATQFHSFFFCLQVKETMKAATKNMTVDDVDQTMDDVSFKWVFLLHVCF